MMLVMLFTPMIESYVGLQRQDHGARADREGPQTHEAVDDASKCGGANCCSGRGAQAYASSKAESKAKGAVGKSDSKKNLKPFNYKDVSKEDLAKITHSVPLAILS